MSPSSPTSLQPTELLAQLKAAESELLKQPDDRPRQLTVLRLCFLTAEQSANTYLRGLRLSTQLVSQSLDPVLRGYQAAFTGIGARHTPWPIEQFARVSEGMSRFDALVAAHPTVVELRWLRGLVYDKLPPILLRSKSATQDLNWVAEAMAQGRDGFEADFRPTAVASVLAAGARLESRLRRQLEELT